MDRIEDAPLELTADLARLVAYTTRDLAIEHKKRRMRRP